MLKDKKNRNIKGLKIGQEAAKPGTLTSKPKAANSAQVVQAHGSNAQQPAHPSNNFHNRLTEQLATLELGLEFKLELRAEDLSVIKDIGSGNGGTVSKCRHNPTGAIMARKLVHIDAKPEVRKQIVRELQFMHDCHSPYIVSFYGAYLSDPYVCLCMEFMDRCSLDHIYRKVGPIPQPVLGKIALAVVSGLTYLYDVHRIMHRDVKPSNVLVNSTGAIKICDFGVSGELINSIADTFVGTSTYMSPERIQGAKYTVKSDVWSLGITLIELALGRFPLAYDDDDDESSPGTAHLEDEFDNITLSPSRPSRKDAIVSERAQKEQSDKSKSKKSKKPTRVNKPRPMPILELLQHVVNEPAPTLPESKFPSEIREFVDACVEKDYEKRPTPKQLMTFSWIVDGAECDVDLESWARSLP